MEKNEYEKDLSYFQTQQAFFIDDDEWICEKKIYKNKDYGYFIVDNNIIFYYDKCWKYETSKMYIGKAK